MNWLGALALAAAVTLVRTAHQNANWEYTQPWKPLRASCPACKKESRILAEDLQASGSTNSAVKENQLTFENLKPGVPTRLSPDGSTTIVKMVMEKFKTPNNSSVQLVYIPSGHLSNLADKGWAKMVTAESNPTPSTVIQAPFSTKQKRDHRTRPATTSNRKTFPMTLVAAEDKQAAAREQLQLLEAALSSPEATKSNNGELPRVFIAPSNIPPPPGYVKIPLVPQKQTHSTHNKLPPTFLTHSNPRPLPPGFVRLSLPASVSHLSQEIPLVKPEKISRPFSSNAISETSSRKQSNHGSVVSDRSVLPPPPLFDARGNSVSDVNQHIISNERFVDHPSSSRPQPRDHRKKLQTDNFSQPEMHLQEDRRTESRNERTPNPIVGQQQTSHFSIAQHSRPKFVDEKRSSSRENLFKSQNSNRLPTPQISVRQQLQNPFTHTPNSGLQSDISDPRFVVQTNLSPGNFKHQLRLQNFNQNAVRPLHSSGSIHSSLLPSKTLEQVGSNFRVTEPPIGNSGGFLRQSQEQHNQGKLSHDHRSPVSSERSRPTPETIHPKNEGPRSFVNQNIAHPGIQSHERLQPQTVVNSNEKSQSVNPLFRPLSNAVNTQQIQQFVSETDRRNRVQTSSISPLHSNNDQSVHFPQTETANLKLIPAKGIQVVSKGEPKPVIEPREQTSARPTTQNFINPQTFVQPSTGRSPPSHRLPQSSQTNIQSNIGTPATIPFRNREKERNEVTGIPPPHDPRFDEMIKKQERESALTKQRNQSLQPIQNENIHPFNSIAAVPEHGKSTRVQLHSNVRVNNQDRPLQPLQSSSPRNENPPANKVPIRVTSFPPVSSRATFAPPTTPQRLPSPLTTVTPRITTFSPPHRFRLPTTPFKSFTSTTPTPATSSSSAFTPPLFSQPFSTSVPSLISNVLSTTPLFEHNNGEFAKNRETILDPFTGRPFTSNENQAFSVESPVLSSTVKAINQHPPFEGNHQSTAIFTSTPRTFSTTGSVHSSNATDSFEFATEVPSSEVRTVGPFKIQPFFNSFALPQSPVNSFEIQQSGLTPREQFENARDAAVRPFLSSTTSSPSTFFAPFVSSTQKNDLPPVALFSNERHNERFPSSQRFPERPPLFSGRLPVPQNSIPFNQPSIFNNGQFNRLHSGKVFPTPQKINNPENKFIEIKKEEERVALDTNEDLDTSIFEVTTIEVTTIKPDFSVTSARSNQKGTTLAVPSAEIQTEESTLGSVERQEETTLFPPFNVVRKRLRLNKIKENHKKEKSDDDPSKKTHPLVFGRRLRPRFRPASNSDQTQSGSKPRVMSRIVTSSPIGSRSRLNISSRFRERSRLRTTTSTTESTSAFSERLTPATEVPESALTPVEVGLVQKTVSKSTVRDGTNLQKRERRPRPAGQRRRRPNGRKVPEWVRERRRRLRKKLTTEAPAPRDTSIDDLPADFIDDNAFSLAESARVTFTQPRENSHALIEISATEISPTYEIDPVTEIEQFNDEFKNVNFDEATTEAILFAEGETQEVTTERIKVSPTTFLNSGNEPLASGQVQDLQLGDSPRFPIGRRIVPPLTRTYVNTGKHLSNDFDSEKITILETSKYEGRFPTMQLPTAVQAHLPRRHNAHQLPPTLDRSFPLRYRITHPSGNPNKHSSSEILTETNIKPDREIFDDISGFEDSTDGPKEKVDTFSIRKSMSDIDPGPQVDFIPSRVSPASSTGESPSDIHIDDLTLNSPPSEDERMRLNGEGSDTVTDEFNVKLNINATFDSQKVTPSDNDNPSAHKFRSDGNRYLNDNVSVNPSELLRPINTLVEFQEHKKVESRHGGDSQSYSLTEESKPDIDLDDHVDISFSGVPSSNVDEARRTFEYDEYEDDDEAVAESRRHVIYAHAPSAVAEIYENVGSTTSKYDQIEQIESVTVDSNDEHETDRAIFSSELFRTVADGFKKAEETQIAIDESLSVTDIPVSEAPQSSSTMSTFEEIESLLRSPSQSTEKNESFDSKNPAANLAGKEGTVIGYSTVLEIRSSEPKVCFSNGRCIPAKDSVRR